jgi:hypothetical protein
MVKFVELWDKTTPFIENGQLRELTVQDQSVSRSLKDQYPFQFQINLDARPEVKHQSHKAKI